MIVSGKPDLYQVSKAERLVLRDADTIWEKQRATNQLSEIIH